MASPIDCVILVTGQGGGAAGSQLRRHPFLILSAIMYESLTRPPVDPRLARGPIDGHFGTRQGFVTRVKLAVIDAANEGRMAIKAIGPQLIDWITDTRMLRQAWDVLAAKGETAPGPNGHRYDDYDDHEVWSRLKLIRGAVRSDTFRAGPERKVKIPKDRTDPDRGERTLTLINVEDRVVQRSVIEVLQPFLDSLFGRNVRGFRPRRGRLHAFALAERLAMTENRYVFVVEDLADAFDHVPIHRLLDVLGVYIPADEVLRLLERLLDAGASHGIQQGGPLSPILLNIYLHHFLDEPWRTRCATIPMVRVADDMLLLCRTKKEAEQARARLQELLVATGMPLKVQDNGPVYDLRKAEVAPWLGFLLGKGREGLSFQVGAKAWRRLAEHLTVAHEKPDTAFRAAATIAGWIDQLGPCYKFVKRPEVREKLADLAAKLAFDEIPSRNAISSRWRRAHEQWRKVRDAVRERPQVLDSAWARETLSEPVVFHVPVDPSEAPF